ncbi:MFS transporter [Flavobacterium degerlachei]|uniref:MFS transporter, PAT family, beta-lactamase induction signal transducer AmpG n=1 Tax=Flavobacterium degerlachei TaxID=229203 RepID=A0A1H2UR99_9FLAO|nr:MFS transporter [Flavobacterium degerlachei]SDW58666.1 MFS transporter, PAT family, beta-lactamase induction signal transducer AmpG [Flavobacterium degerlachei]
MEVDNRPWYWIPILNFASGLPYAIIISVSVIMYKNLGISNEDIGIYTSLLYLPWVIKPLWSPFIDLYSTKRKWFLAMQLVISIAFLIVGLSIPMNHFFVISLAVFWVAAFASASNDVASDGFYMLALEKDQQSFFLGIRSTFYRLSMLTGNGLIVIIGGYLEQEYGDKQKAWSYTMIIVGLLMTLITIYNYFATPRTEKAIVKNSVEAEKASFSSVFSSFFQKKQIGIALAFILLFRLGESQLLKMLTPFLIDDISVGGIGLTTQDVGIIYGTFGVISLTVGGIIGGIVISRDGLGKWMLPMILAMHLPIIGFILLAHFHPTSVYYIYATVIAEQFGYGFGFAAFMMYLIYVADGESKTSHYSIATGFMALGMMLPGMLSGFIQEYLGYGNFFIWVFLATIPGLILSRFLIYPKEFGKKVGQENS